MLTSIMIGNKILEARKQKNLSQAQLAVQLSVSSQAVGKWERGESMPDIITFNRLAEVLGVDMNYFSESTPPITAQPVENLCGQSIIPLSENEEKDTGWDMSKGNWTDSDFSGLSNLHEKFSSSNMQHCLFVGSELSGLLLRYNNVDDCDFTDSDISGSRIKGSSITNNSFRNCSLRDVEFSSSQIKTCNFTGADFTGAIIRSSTFQKNTTSNAVWNRTAFHSSHFVDIVFEGVWKDCSFDNCSFNRLTFQNATLTNTFFKCNRMKRIRFIECKTDKITYAFLKSGKADLNGVTLLTP